MTTTTSLTGAVASTVLSSLQTSNTSSTAANTALSGLIGNLASAQTQAGLDAGCRAILATPNAGAVGTIAEAILQVTTLGEPTYIADANIRSLLVAQKIAGMQAIAASQTKTNGVISSFLAGLGL